MGPLDPLSSAPPEGAERRRSGLLGLFLGVHDANALVVELQDDGVVNQTIHCSHRRHGIFEDLVPWQKEGHI